MLVLLYPGLQGVAEVGTNPKGRSVSFKVIPSNDSILYFYAPSRYTTRNQLVRGCCLKGLHTCMENKCEGNENKIILGDFISTMDKMDRDCGNKTKKLYRCYSNYALSKLIVGDGIENLWRRENPESSEFTH